MSVPWKTGTVWMWRSCGCEALRQEAAQHRVRALEAGKAQADADMLLGDSGMSRIAHFQLDRFVPEKLAGDDKQHPYHISSRWLAAASDRPTADYQQPLPAALYFYSPGKGRGKTHLAAALAWEARRLHKLAAFVEEGSFLDQLWSCPFDQRKGLLVLPGDRAWLTVIDDFGRREKTSASTSDAWNGIINRRWLRRGWTIITSNWTLEQLAERGTIDDAAYSRLRQMTRGRYVQFDGTDQRLV